MTRPSVTTFTLLLAGLVLSGCGSDDAATQDAPATPTQAELAEYVDSSSTDARAISDAVVAQFQQTKAFPESADGLADLAEGNYLGLYEPDGESAKVCVEHRIGEQDVAFASFLVNAAGDQVSASPLSTGENTGCL